MSRCIFCGSPLSADTKPEHILLSALGGRKTTSRVVCSTCNNDFGGGIDKALADQVAVLRNLLQLPSGTRKPPPVIPRISAGDQTITFRSDGTPELVAKPFTLKRRDDGTVEVAVLARNEKELSNIASHVAAALGLPLEQVHDQFIQASAHKIERRPDTVHFQISLGGVRAVQAITKACLVLWATVVGNEELSCDAYRSARQFVIDGSDAFNHNRARLDSRVLPNAPLVEKSFGPLFNFVQVISNHAGAVIGHFTIYNAIGFQVVLAESGGAPDKSIGLVSNPLDPATWAEHDGGELAVPFSWVESPEYSLDASQKRVAALVRHYVESARPKEIGRICDEVFSRHELAEHEEIPPTLREQVFADLIERLAAFALGLPSERALTPDELRRILAGS